MFRRRLLAAGLALATTALACTCGSLSELGEVWSTVRTIGGEVEQVVTEVGPTLEIQLTALGPTLEAGATSLAPTLEAGATNLAEQLTQRGPELLTLESAAVATAEALLNPSATPPPGPPGPNDPVNPLAFEITPGETHTATLDDAAVAHNWLFAATAGQSVTVDVQSQGGGVPTVQIVAPDGTVLTEVRATTDLVVSLTATIPADGTYTARVTLSAPSAYAITLR